MKLGIGIELCPRAVRCVLLEKTSAAPHVSAVLNLPCDSTQPQALGDAFQRLKRKLKIHQPVVLGLPSTSAILATVHPLIVNLKRALLGVEFELQQQLPFDVHEACWHFQWLSPVNGGSSLTKSLPSKPIGHKRALEHAPADLKGSSSLSLAQTLCPPTVVAAMKGSLLEERLGLCRRAGLKVHAITVNALALWNTWQRIQETRSNRPSSSVLLHLIDSGAAEWLLQRPDGIQVIPVILNPDQSESSVSHSTEEESKPGSQVQQTQLYGSLLQALTVSWESLRVEMPEGSLTVGVAASSGLQESLRQILSRLGVASIVSIEPVQALTRRVSPESVGDCSAVAFGLALQGLGRTEVPVRLNLLDGTQREERFLWRRRVAAFMSAISLFAFMGWTLHGMNQARSEHLKILESLQQRQKQYERLRPTLRAILKQQEEAQQRTQQLTRLVNEPAVLTRYFISISEALPADVWLTKLELSREESIAASGFQRRIINGILEGHASSFNSVTQFVEQLKQLEGVSSVKPLATHVITLPASASGGGLTTAPSDLASAAPLAKEAYSTAQTQTPAGASATHPAPSVSSNPQGMNDVIAFVVQIQMDLTTPPMDTATDDSKASDSL